MKTKFRVLVTLQSVMASIVLFWLTGYLIMFILPVLGLVYTIMGGKIHG